MSFIKLKNQDKISQGFTLIELLLSISLLAISVGISSDIIVTLVRTYSKAQILNDMEISANFVFQKLQNDIRNSVNASVHPSGSRLTLTLKNGGTLVYRVTSDDPPQLTRNNIPLLDTSSVIGGVRLSCPQAMPNSQCFELVNSTPATVQANFTFSQSTGAGIFNTSVSLQDAFVVRGSY